LVANKIIAPDNHLRIIKLIAMLSALKHSWSNGSVLIVTGGVCAGISGFVLYRMEDEEKNLKTEITTNNNKLLTSNDVTPDPILYRATVIRALSASFDGPVSSRRYILSTHPSKRTVPTFFQFPD
jgi:hypothetical protein